MAMVMAMAMAMAGQMLVIECPLLESSGGIGSR